MCTGCYCAQLSQGELPIMELVHKHTCHVMHCGDNAIYVTIVSVVLPIYTFRCMHNLVFYYDEVS